MTEMETLQDQARRLSDARDHLTGVMEAMQREVARVRDQYMAEIRQAARRVAADQNQLSELIEANPQLFGSPRTQVVNGLKFGLQKQKGRLTWGKDEDVVMRIQKAIDAGELSTAQEDTLIVYRARPVAAGLEQLDARMLKRLGVTVVDATDQVLIKSVDGALEKAVRAIIREVTEREEAGVRDP